MLDVKEISALEAWEILNSTIHSVLVDTRTENEWNIVGAPVLEDRIKKISSHLAPNMEFNSNFLKLLNNEVMNKKHEVIFMCKTNGRSRVAADLASKNGYTNCFVVKDGFEGSNLGPGWKNSNLPFEKN